MVELYIASIHGLWGSSNVYSPPVRHWYFDQSFYINPPPGTLELILYTKAAGTLNNLARAHGKTLLFLALLGSLGQPRRGQPRSDPEPGLSSSRAPRARRRISLFPPKSRSSNTRLALSGGGVKRLSRSRTWGPPARSCASIPCIRSICRTMPPSAIG